MRAYVVVIPAYNEAATIREVALAALAQVPHLIVVDDASVDGTSKALDGLPVELLRNAHNRGKAGSLRRGIDAALAAGADAVITLDGDGQHLPHDIPRLVELAERHPDAIVIGARLQARNDVPRPRYFANRFANFWIAWAAGQRIADSQSGFRVYPAAVLRQARACADRAASFVFESEILIEAGRRGTPLLAVPIAARYGAHYRRSHFRPVVDVLRIVRMVAWKLLARGLHLPGLVRSLRALPPIGSYRPPAPGIASPSISPAGTLPPSPPGS